MMRRPLRYWLVALGLLVMTVSGGLRLAGAVQRWNWLAAAGVSPGPGYLAVSGALVLLTGAGAILLLLWRPYTRVALWSARGVALGYALWYWGDRLLFTRDVATRVNQPFALGLTLALLLSLFAATRVKQSKQRSAG